MNEQRIYWNRVGYLKIQMDNGELQQFGGDGEMFDMKFEGRKWGDFYSTFRCSILGLTREHINALTIWDKGEALMKKRYIEVYAGYSSIGNDMASPIFKGYVMNAIPTSPPEMWMNFECIRAWDKDDYVAGVDKDEKKSPVEILKKIAELTGLSFSERESWRISDNTIAEKKADFIYSGFKRCQLPYLFAKQFDCRIIDQNGTIVASDKRGWLSIPEPNDLMPSPISQDNGLLAVGNVNMTGARIVHRLDNRFKLCSWVKLDSRLIPKANAKPYFVNAVTHIGHLRGDKWQTEVDLIRRGANI